MKTIYLHVGNFKTGTSAIQKFCSDSRSKLLEGGYDYISCARPRNNHKNHGQLPLSLIMKHGGYTPKWYNEKNDYRSVSSAVIEEIANSKCENIIISSEEFYRIAGYKTAIVQPTSHELKELFSGHKVRVLMYVREPLEMLKSWYNQANKHNVPTRRFMDFFYYMNTSLLLPQKNTAFWRGCFGPECLILEPYHLSGAQHIHRFFELIGAQLTIAEHASGKLINRKRSEETLELDRIARIMLITDAKERAIYLESFAFRSPSNKRLLLDKIDSINNGFQDFCQAENIAFDSNTDFTLDDIMAYEKKINRESSSAFSSLKRRLAQIRYSRLANLIKRAI